MTPTPTLTPTSTSTSTSTYGTFRRLFAGPFAVLFAVPFAGVLLCTAALAAPAAKATPDTPDTPVFSAAERLLFMARPFGDLRLPGTLRYTFRKTGSLEEGFQDTVHMLVSALADGACCQVRGDFLSGARRLPLPEIEGAEGNPVVMYFLEYDLRTMQRLTKGSQGHFRKRIRMALSDAAKVAEVQVRYRGRDVAAKEVLISPYLEDPNRPRFEKFAGKQYRFVLSEAVPGGVYSIRSQIVGEAAGAAPLIVEELFIEGAQALDAKATP